MKFALRQLKWLRLEILEKILIFKAALKMGGFLYRLHYVRQTSTTKIWNGLILTKPSRFDTMVSRGHPESEKRKERKQRGLAENAKKWKTKRKQDT